MTDERDTEKEKHVEEARKYLRGIIYASDLDIDGRKAFMENSLRMAGVGYEALDPDSKKTHEQMEEEVNRYYKESYVRNAIGKFRSLENGEAVNPKLTVSLIEFALEKAGAEYEVLDIDGKRSSREIREILDFYLNKKDMELPKQQKLCDMDEDACHKLPYKIPHIDGSKEIYM